MSRPHTAAVVPYRRSTTFDLNLLSRPHPQYHHYYHTLIHGNNGFNSAKKSSFYQRELPAIKPSEIATYTKFSPSDWLRHNENWFSTAEANRNLSKKLRGETASLLRETEEVTDFGQKEVGKRIGERLNDISFWSYELSSEIDKLLVETNNLAESKRKLVKAAADTEQPLRVAQECLYYREKRTGVDMVHDRVEQALLKEIDVIKKCQRLMSDLNDQLQMQLENNRAAQHRLEKDYHDKQDAFNIDNNCHILSNTSAALAYHKGVETIDRSASVPNTWAEYSNHNIQRSQLERSSSARLRAEVDTLTATCATEIWLAGNNVDAAVSERVAEVEDARRQMHTHRSSVSHEIEELQRYIDFLKQAIQSKIRPLQLAETRLESRAHRPNIELCRDPPQLRLVQEVNELHESIEKLQRKLRDAEKTMQELVSVRSDLDQELKVKANSVFIDREQCQGIRKSMPYRGPPD
ncbi:tektin 2 (testicular) [Chamberlinius hualienensis]